MRRRRVRGGCNLHQLPSWRPLQSLRGWMRQLRRRPHLRSGNCADVLLETCDGFDTCLCNSSCKLFTDNYLKCMKGVSCASDTCSDSPGTTISGDNNADQSSSKVPKGGLCTEDDDCENGTCAREEAIYSADFVCCQSDEKDRYSSSFGFVCKDLPDGAYCKGIESFCTSGYCDDDGFVLRSLNQIQMSLTLPPILPKNLFRFRVLLIQPKHLLQMQAVR